MQKTITTLIPQYGELNRICKDWIISHTFSFEKQKFIVDFYSEWNDITAFEQAILELVLHTPPEPCTLLLKSLKKEVREYTRLYESYRLPNDEVIMRVCNQYADSYKEAIKEEMEEVNRLRKPMNEANNRYDSIGYREHTPEEEKLAEREYERCKAEYEREKAQLDHLYEQQTLLWKEAQQYMKNRCDDIYLLSVHFMGILTKYVPDEESQPNEADRQSRTDSQPEAETTTASTTATTAGLPEYFSMKLISLIHEVCAGEQFEDITAPDFYACMNLHPCQCVLKIKPREKIRVCYLISLMREQLPGQDKDKWKEAILKHLDIDEDYYKSKYREPVSDLPSIPNQKFAKEMDGIFRYPVIFRYILRHNHLYHSKYFLSGIFYFLIFSDITEQSVSIIHILTTQNPT